MEKTLMVGLTEKDMQAVVRSYNLQDFYFPTLFPLKETMSLKWKSLIAQAGLKIAADLVSRGSRIPKKVRNAISRIEGDIPKLAIAREKNEDELTEYDVMVAMSSGDSNLRALVEFWAEDTKFCWDGIAARLEWIALKSASLGKISFSDSNNAAVVTEYDIDYEIPSTKKFGVKTSWTVGSSAKPFDDILAVVRAKANKGIKYKFAFMTPETFEAFAAQEQVQKACASLTQSLTESITSPNVEAVNKYLMQNSTKFKGLQFIIIDQDIAIEKGDHTQESGNPFEQNVIMFSETKVLGNTYWRKPIDLKLKDTSKATMVMQEYILIKKYSQSDIVQEVTEGIANAFPAMPNASRQSYMQVDATSWNKN